jgi:hypothetical protein
MASPIGSYDEAGRALMALLLTAAGIPEDKRFLVRSIECRCAVGEIVTFTVVKGGDEDDLAKAVTK